MKTQEDFPNRQHLNTDSEQEETGSKSLGPEYSTYKEQERGPKGRRNGSAPKRAFLPEVSSALTNG